MPRNNGKSLLGEKFWKKVDLLVAEIRKNWELEAARMEQSRRFYNLLEKVAVKVGVPVNW